jgi:murein L,D-transpeptidase YcbB/YkuD
MILCSWAGWSLAAQADPVQEAIRERVERLASTGALAIGEASVAARLVIPAFYERRDHRPAWTDPADVQALIRLADRAETEGLDPEDYHVGELRRLLHRVEISPDEPTLEADLDILLTESLLRLGYHLRFGKVNPEELDPDWNLSRSLDGIDPATRVQQAIDAESLEEFVDLAMPRGPLYARLKEALARYRELAAAGGWPQIPDGKVLKAGMEDDRVPRLRESLSIRGDYTAGAPANPRMFDAPLVDAVLRFQERHGLDADGAVGRKTLEVLNVAAEQRVDQIRVNLERARWIMRDLEPEFVIVNIAGFRVRLIRDGEIVWTTRAQVGKTYRKTPVFKSNMKYLEFNPTWTVPPTILAKDVLPAIQRDPGYLRKENMNVIDRQGKIVDPAGIDWTSYKGRGFPYSIRQEPGPNNPLGRVKFIFPNKHFVFLHDTPSRGLFDRAERTFSSGCIRIEYPLEFAELLLADLPGWNQDKIRETIDGKKTQRVHLAEPLTVLLLYWTVGVEEPGPVRFLNDVYGRDPAVLRALDAEFKVSVPKDIPEYLRQN